MITEQEVMEAAKVILRGWDDYYRPKTQREVAEHKAATWITEELARREAEQAERAKPITAELCKALGAVVTSPTFAFFRIPDAHNLNVYLDPDDSYVAYSDKSIPGVATMGQLLDMLAALKGRPA